MKCNNKVYAAFLCFWMISGVPLGSMAAGIPGSPTGLAIDGTPMEPIPPPTSVTLPGNDGLLSGMTPDNYKIPSGWNLVVTQNFEGTCPASESCGGGSGAITTTRPHTGSRSVEGTYGNDQANVRWALRAGNLGGFSEIYTSWWEYTDSTALFNDEYFMWIMQDTIPSFEQEVILDWYWAPGFNKPTATLYTIQQGVCSPGRKTMKSGSPGTGGTWQQFEVHFRPDTGSSNGFMRVYRNGSLYTSYENGNFVCGHDMTNSLVQVGGTYTKLVWMTDYPTCSIPSGCSTAPGKGSDMCTSSMKWNNQLFSNPKCNPVDPPLPSFKRYFDDIIVMKK